MFHSQQHLKHYNISSISYKYGMDVCAPFRVTETEEAIVAKEIAS